MQNKFTMMATIPKTAERCRAEGLGVSAHQLRTWCKSGKLKHIQDGRIALIYWPNLLAFLAGEGSAREPDVAPVVPFGTVRPVPER